MRFLLVDAIVELVPGKSIRTVKNLTLAEEYLADHFPTFPVMPGVLMLEALVQSAAWLVRSSEDFRHSVIVLREAKGVKCGNFVAPGKRLEMAVDVAKPANGSAEITFKGTGTVGGKTAVSARFALERYNLADRDPALAQVDQQLVDHYRTLYGWLRRAGERAVLPGGNA